MPFLTQHEAMQYTKSASCCTSCRPGKTMSNASPLHCYFVSIYAICPPAILVHILNRQNGQARSKLTINISAAPR